MGKFGGPTDLLVGLSLALFATGCFGSNMWIYPFTIGRYEFRVYDILLVFVFVGAIISVSK